jgi:adenylate cyclase 9
MFSIPGNILCGIVGTKRVKFDVWSNDVTFANKMESTGTPDLVHISEETKKFLDGSYNMREAEEIEGHKTYFILGRKNTVSSPLEHRSIIENNQKNLQLELQSKKLKNLSTNDIPSISPTSPTVAVALHQSKSLSPSPILNTRKRLASISETVSKLLTTSTRITTNNEQNKALLDQRIKCPNPKIVIGISEMSDDVNGTNGIILEEPPRNEPAPTTNTNNVVENSSSNNDCDKLNEKLVPYNGSGGYQQVPSVVEIEANHISQSSHEKGENMGDDSSVNITDLRSYISQSRCDVSPFSRAGSHRSDRHHNHHNHQRSLSQQSNALSPWYQMQPDYLSPSRKDSGFPTNSRRSSIQHPNYYKNSLTTHNRVSGYFTSSQSSLYPSTDNQTDDMAMRHLPSPATGVGSAPRSGGEDTLKACVQHLRKQSDLQLIRCVRDNARSQRSYLVKPPIRKFSLSFESTIMEKTFRNKAHRYECDEDVSSPTYTLATPKFNTFIDIFVLSLVFGMVALSLFLLSPSIYTREYKVWVCCFVSFSSLILTVLFLCSKQICRRPRRTRHFNSIFGWASKYYPWNFFGSILISLPVASILINFALVDIKKFPTIQFYYGLMLFVCLIHFCNFIQLNCWTKNILALISGVAFVVIGYSHREISKTVNGLYHMELNRNFTLKHQNDADTHWFKNYEYELCLDLFLVLILVFLINREFEIGYRLSFYGNEVANQDKVRVQNMKNQADLLLHNIIPKHVAEELKNTAKYSKNHQDVGIIFASIVNFNEMYDESYLGGKEYLRVLNELIGGKSNLTSS